MNFTDLRNLQDPSKKGFSIPGIDDNTVYKFNPKRFRFYLKLQNALNDPETLRKVLYKYTELKMDDDRQNEMIQEIVDGIKEVSLFYDNNKLDSLVDRIKNALNSKIGSNDDAKKLITEDLKNIIHKKGGAGEEEAKDLAIDPKILYDYKKPIETYNKTIQNIAGDNDLAIDSVKLDKIRNVINRSKDDTYLSKLNITYTDRLIFIAITYIIRIITLLLIEWSLNAGIINSFYKAFIYYCIIYIIIFIFVIMIVNVNYNYPVVQLFTDNSIANIPSMFYYFYIYTNGITRLLAHIFIILILMIIPFVIKEDQISNDTEIAFNYKVKNKINTSLTKFSFMIFIFTSIIALKF